MVEKTQELTRQAAQLKDQQEELSNRLNEAREQLLLLGDVDRRDELKGASAWVCDDEA